jgi:hypothetical protein
VTSRSASGSASGLSTTASTVLNIAVAAPIPIATIRMATAVKPGVAVSWRTA